MSNEEKMWDSICKVLEEENGIEIQTINKNGIPNLWILIEKSSESIIVSKAKNHTPASKISVKRFIGRNEFVRVSEKYKGWRDGTESRSVVQKISQNSSYIFAIVNYLLNKKKDIYGK